MMLAVMQQATFAQTHEQPLSTMTASLSISSPLQLPPQPYHLKPERPKLSLNTRTAQTRTFGKGSSLRLETLSAISPTVRNTFSNAYEAPRVEAASTSKPARPRLVVDSSVGGADLSEAGTPVLASTNTPLSASTPSSGSTASTTSSTDSATIRVPYKLAHNIRSILSNSPIPQMEVRATSFSTSRPMFPAQKRVSFRAPLEEEVKTSKYTWAHSDIGSSGSSTTVSSLSTDSSSSVEISASSSSSETTSSSSPSSSEAKLTSAESIQSSEPESSSQESLSSNPSRSSESSSPHVTRLPRAGEKRDSSESESDSDSCPETPVAGRRKKRREWVWTLGPVVGKQGSSDEQSTSDDDSS